MKTGARGMEIKEACMLQHYEIIAGHSFVVIAVFLDMGIVCDDSIKTIIWMGHTDFHFF